MTTREPDWPLYEWNHDPGAVHVVPHEHEWVEVTRMKDADRHWICSRCPDWICSRCPDWRVEVHRGAAEA